MQLSLEKHPYPGSVAVNVKFPEDSSFGREANQEAVVLYTDEELTPGRWVLYSSVRFIVEEIEGDVAILAHPDLGDKL